MTVLAIGRVELAGRYHCGLGYCPQQWSMHRHFGNLQLSCLPKLTTLVFSHHSSPKKTSLFYHHSCCHSSTRTMLNVRHWTVTLENFTRYWEWPGSIELSLSVPRCVFPYFQPQVLASRNLWDAVFSQQLPNNLE